MKVNSWDRGRAPNFRKTSYIPQAACFLLPSVTFSQMFFAWLYSQSSSLVQRKYSEFVWSYTIIVRDRNPESKPCRLSPILFVIAIFLSTYSDSTLPWVISYNLTLPPVSFSFFFCGLGNLFLVCLTILQFYNYIGLESCSVLTPCLEYWIQV